MPLMPLTSRRADPGSVKSQLVLEPNAGDVDDIDNVGGEVEVPR